VLLYSDKVKTFMEHKVRRPPFRLGHVKCGKIIFENNISFRDKVTDKLAGQRERRVDCYTDKILNEVISSSKFFISYLIHMKNSRQVL
jgi:hypothetical protein